MLMLRCTSVVGIKKIKTFQVVCHEKARCTTMLTYINGEGFALPPMVIHRGKYHDSWRIGVPPGSLLGGLKKDISTSNYLLSMAKC